LALLGTPAQADLPLPTGLWVDAGYNWSGSVGARTPFRADLATVNDKGKIVRFRAANVPIEFWMPESGQSRWVKVAAGRTNRDGTVLVDGLLPINLPAGWNLVQVRYWGIPGFVAPSTGDTLIWVTRKGGKAPSKAPPKAPPSKAKKQQKSAPPPSPVAQLMRAFQNPQTPMLQVPKQKPQ
jgi:hypothetical protein